MCVLMSDISILVERLPLAVDLETKLGVSWMPHQATPFDAGFDVRACVTTPVKIYAKTLSVIPTGLKFEIQDPYWEIQVRSRSGLAAKHGISVLNSPGTVDYLYRDEVKVILYNHGSLDFLVQPGDRIAQLCVRPVPTVTWQEGLVTQTSRGGFGSTGAS